MYFMKKQVVFQIIHFLHGHIKLQRVEEAHLVTVAIFVHF